MFLKRLPFSFEKECFKAHERNTKYTAPIRHSAAHKWSSFSVCPIYITANGTNTESVITSCKIFSWGKLKCVKPMRFAGTISIYSKSAMPQLASAATYHFLSDRFFKCEYQANVIKTFEQISSNVVWSITGIGVLKECFKRFPAKLLTSVIPTSVARRESFFLRLFDASC